MREERNINALFDEKSIRVYQAFNNEIADEAIKSERFGASFKMDRMTWIKPSFLWMMYRSGWGTKINQERILAIEITLECFNSILSCAVTSSYNLNIYSTTEEWSNNLHSSQARYQWDPDRDIRGNPINRRAIQLGIKGEILNKYLTEGILKIADITNNVIKWRAEKDKNVLDISELPEEKEYQVDDKIKKTLGMS